MAVIVPSILTQTIEDFVAKVGLISDFPDASEVHVDFADDRFVPNRTIVPAALPQLPLRQVFEAHLMVRSPESVLPDLEKCGF